MSEGSLTHHHIVVVNQHGDNRGDEAAMRSMAENLAEGLPGARFTIVHQFSDPRSEVDLGVPVDYISLKLPVLEGLRLVLYALFRRLAIPSFRVLGPIGRRLVERYTGASVVISAPGGPYFGDIYADHELVHWFYVWLGRVIGRPLVLYAPSVGPFNNVALNLVRRRGFAWFDKVTVRDEVSARYLREFMGEGFQFELAADSAFQSRSTLKDASAVDSNPFRVVVAVRDPGEPLSARHDDAVVSAVESVSRKVKTEVIFLPQVHGPRHDDQPYLTRLADQIVGAASIHVEDGNCLSSDDHRRIVSSADLVIAGRYHPAVFAVASATPVVVIAYEHKSWGLARRAGVEPWTVDVSQIRADKLIDCALDAVDRSTEIRATLQTRISALREAATRSTAAVLEAVEGP